MGNDFYHFEKVKNSRKRYKCYHCGDLTEKERVKYVGVFEGDFSTAQFHPECWNQARLSHKSDDYWPEEHSMVRGENRLK